MKKKTIFKVILGSVIASFLFVFTFMLVNPVHAEEVENTTPATTETTTNEEETTTTTIDTTPSEVVEQTNTALKTAVDFIKNFSSDDARAWFIALCTKLGIDTALLFGLAFGLLRTRLKEHRQSEFYKELMAKMDAQHQEKVEQLVQEFDNKLIEVQNVVTDSIKQLDEKKRKEAEDDIAVLKNNLETLKAEIEK